MTQHVPFFQGFSLISFLLGAGFALAVVAIRMMLQISAARKRACTSCGRKAAYRLVEVYDFDTNRLQRGILCAPCARYSDRLRAPPWA